MRRVFRIFVVVGLGVVAGCAEQNALPPNIASMLNNPKNALESRIYTGRYLCNQGTTGLSLQILGKKYNETVAIFHFYPLPANLNVSSGSFIVKGAYDPILGPMSLYTVSWITRPARFTMVGLSGTSTDKGHSFDGSLTDSLFCSTFSIAPTSTI
jgi:hypothetical protein